MRLTVSTANLAAALKRASRCTGNGRTGHPVLACVLLTATADSLTIAGFDLQTGISLSIPASVDATGSLAVNAQVITNLVAALPDDLPITLEQPSDGEQLSIACGSSRYGVATQFAADYPELPQPKATDSACSVNSASFLEACRHARAIAATDESKGIICGVSIRLDDVGGYEIAATDGHRLVQFGALANPTAQAIVPSRTLQQLERFQHPEQVTVILSAGTVHFLAGDGQALSGRTLDGTYPKYEQLFPQAFSGDFTINRHTLRDAAGRAAIIAANSNDVLHLSPSEDDGILTISATNDTGQACETVALDSCSAPCAFALNADYLREALDPFAHELVTVHLNTATTPIVIQPSDPDAQVQPIRVLVMPVQVRSAEPAPAKAKAKQK